MHCTNSGSVRLIVRLLSSKMSLIFSLLLLGFIMSLDLCWSCYRNYWNFKINFLDFDLVLELVHTDLKYFHIYTQYTEKNFVIKRVLQFVIGRKSIKSYEIGLSIESITIILVIDFRHITIAYYPFYYVHIVAILGIRTCLFSSQFYNLSLFYNEMKILGKGQNGDTTCQVSLKYQCLAYLSNNCIEDKFLLQLLSLCK